MATKPIGIDEAGNLPARARTKLAMNLADGSTPEGSALTANFVRFVDQNGDQLPVGSVTTIHVNTVTGDIDDITFEEA